MKSNQLFCKGVIFLVVFGICIPPINGQFFSKQDSLRGSITNERSWWDLNYYHLEVEVFPSDQKIKGKNTIKYTVLNEANVMQIDLQPPLKIIDVQQNGKLLNFTSDINAHFIQLEEEQNIGDINEIQISYGGKPRPALNAPWDGGFSWKKDNSGNDFIATSCQGLGASVWWPCKDHMYDEVDSMLISIEVPDHLKNVSNGRLRSVDSNPIKKTKTFNWFVSNPINNYGVNINIGNYSMWKAVYKGESGDLDITYWALKQDEARAKKQYQDVPRMLKAFEHWFGPYPFYEDGYQLVQAPYLGMEHQSSVTYGNQFTNGYLGRDLSETGWGLKFDYIIIHESGHEWFANNITHRDMADMWVHESFTTYSESIFLDYYYGKQAGQEYVRGLRSGIENKKPLIGPYNVNYEGYPIDVYPKGANLLNTLRTIVNDDEQWRLMLRSLNKTFKHKTVTSEQIESFIANFFKIDLVGFFDQYLRDQRIPTLEYYFDDKKLFYRWTNCIPYFDMVLDINIKDEYHRIQPTTEWSVIRTNATSLSIEPNYYVSQFKIR